MPSLFVVVHGAADSGSSWDLVADELRSRGHGVVAPDLPVDDPVATWSDYAEVVVAAVGPRSGVVVVAHSLGGFTAPLVCERLGGRARLLVLVAAMLPVPGHPAAGYWTAAGYDRSDPPSGDPEDPETFFHDVPPALVARAKEAERPQSDGPMGEPWPLAAWPPVPTRYLLCRDDRMFPAEVSRRIVRERLGIEPDEIDGGHLPFLSRPVELADRLDRYAADI